MAIRWKATDKERELQHMTDSGVNMEAKKHWNWNTALVGSLTAAILTGIGVGAYLLTSYHIQNYLRVEGTIAETEEWSSNHDSARRESEASMESVPKEYPSTELLKQLYGFSFVLYRDLCVKGSASQGEEAFLTYQTLYFEETPDFSPSAYADEGAKKFLEDQYEAWVKAGKNVTAGALDSIWQNQFAQFNQSYDYWIWDKAAPELVLTNSGVKSGDQIPAAEYVFLFQIDYDAHGMASISESNFASADRDGLRRRLNAILLENPMRLLGGEELLDEMLSQLDSEGTEELKQAVEKALQFQNPRDCSFVLGITPEKWQQSIGQEGTDRKWNIYAGWFGREEVQLFCCALLLLAMLCGFLWLNPKSIERREKRVLARMPFELLLLMLLLLVIPLADWDYWIREWATDLSLGYRRDYGTAVLFGFSFLLIAWYVGGNLGEIRACGLGEYLQKRSLFLRLFAVCKRAAERLYRQYRETDLSEDLRKKVRRLVILQAVLMVVCCCGWVAGILLLIPYSVWLYYRIMKSVLQVQQDYRELAHMTRELANGNLKYEPVRELGLFEPVKKELVQIRNGFDKAVQEEVKSHKMRTELITNVSHDLKTPLTAIITYINLLKDKNISEEDREQYVDTLDQKALRLKTLIEDLFEVSKANSGNVQLKLQKCDLEGLIKQIYYDMEEKLKEKKLITRFSFPEEKVTLLLDGEKTYRIYENLFQNIVKYAMEGTRVYVSMVTEQERVVVTLKNITKAELYVPAQELKERFVRGDASRGSVEGSGLGLAIATSFTELQGGKFDIDIDGDLFKVTMIWKRNG